MCAISLPTQMDKPPIKFAFFGSSRFSTLVLEELEKAGYSPLLQVNDARAPLPELPSEVEWGIVASFGKIIPESYLKIPKHGFVNVHPSLLPELRGPAPIQNLILKNQTPGVTIIQMDALMDHGPILAQEKVSLTPWPDHYEVVEEKLARTGGQLLVKVLAENPETKAQDESLTTYVKMVRKEDGLLDLKDAAEENLRKVLAYSTWPTAYLLFKKKTGEEVRVVVRDASVEDGQFIPTRVIPAGKKEMDWQDFLRGNA